MDTADAGREIGDDRFPQKLRDLDKETIDWLWRLDTEQRDSLHWLCDLNEMQRNRLDLFLALSKENFEAGFTIVEWWSKVAWLGRTGFWIMGGVVAILLFFNQLGAFVSKYFGPGG